MFKFFEESIANAAANGFSDILYKSYWYQDCFEIRISYNYFIECFILPFFLSLENLLPLFESLGQLSTTCCNDTEVVQWAALGCNRPHPATDNGVGDCRSY